MPNKSLDKHITVCFSSVLIELYYSVIFMYLMNNAIYSRDTSVLNYLQQKEIHDLAISFPEVSCEHQLTVGSYDPDCEFCTIR